MSDKSGFGDGWVKVGYVSVGECWKRVLNSGIQIVFGGDFAKLVFPTYDNPLGSTLQGMGGCANMRFRMPI